MKKTILLSMLAVSSLGFAKEEIAIPVEPVQEVVVSEPVLVEIPVVIEVEKPREPYVAIKVGTNLNGSYGEAEGFSEDTDGQGYEVAIEFMKPVNKEIDLGIGVAFQKQADRDSKTIGDLVLIDGNTTDEGSITTEGGTYSSIPVYAVAKARITTFENGITPYFIGNLGYSFNFDEENAKATWNGEKHSFTEESDFDVDNGAYFSVGAGIEYKSMLLEVSHKITMADCDSDNLDYERTTLSIGYKFN